MSSFFVDFELERARHKFFNYAADNFSETVVNEKLDNFFQQYKMCSKSEPDFWVFSEEDRTWKIQIVLRTRKFYTAEPIKVCVHEGRLDQAKSYFQQKWRHRIVK